MYEAITTVIGTVVSNPVTRELPGGDRVVTFRLASTARRLDRDSGEWVDNGTLFLTVSCWRRLVAGVNASIHRGDPVIVQGQLRSNEYRTRDGAERRDLEMRAHTVGPDLTRCMAQVTRWRSVANESGNIGGTPIAEETNTAGEDRQGDTVMETVPPTRHPEPADV
ncbi:single-stranded DNA-binding protein [Nocardia paucivorans]|uniref:single-stranded DNA-binding protein n=1 Tax=Nocardia paucivorans TaxID=114259 RepID=UPI00068597DD|nr:single-stranded DNA-binding protein [Nocardia paucivorans]